MALSKVLVPLMLLILLSNTYSSEADELKCPVLKTPKASLNRVSADSAPTLVPVPRTPVASKPIYLPPRKLIAVQGYVSCKSCADAGRNAILRGLPLPGATVKMICHGKPRDNALILFAVTDKNGYFFIPPTKKASDSGARKRCKVYLHSPPAHSKCQHSTYLHGGLSGAYLRLTVPRKPLPFALFTVGPFAYEPLPSA
ncbi:hypothetical protein MKX01_008970 [Papaver californicum]|nr:hypothetical protein MKX01_008970 [Papaver californicum]